MRLSITYKSNYHYTEAENPQRNVILTASGATTLKDLKEINFWYDMGRLFIRVFIKKACKNPILRKILTRIISVILFLYIVVVKYTSRITVHLPEDWVPDDKRPKIYCFWHGRLIAPLLARKHARNASVLVSRGTDGEMMVVLLKLLRVGIIRGSTDRGGRNKGGVSSLREMLSHLQNEKQSVVLAPDGPVGPLMKAAPGVALLALYAQAPVVGVTINAKPAVRLSSWDRLMLVLPFSRIHITLSEELPPPVINRAVEADSTLEGALPKGALKAHLLNIQNLLYNLTDLNDKKFAQR